MTTRREVPFSSDALAWVHSELAEIKGRLGVIQQTAEQSRGMAVEAADRAHQARSKVDQLDGQPAALLHLQDELRVVRDQLVRVQDDIHSLRQTREELERKSLADGERIRQDRNDIVHQFSDMVRQIEVGQERLIGIEEYSRRHLEMMSQVTQKVELLQANMSELDTLQSRSQASISRLDQDVLRVIGMLPAFEREDEEQRERVASAIEMLSRFSGELEGLKTETNRISRLDDRLELVQAERTRHNERLLEISSEMEKVDERLNQQGERLALIEVRIGGYQTELHALNERLLRDREQIAGYMHSLSELEADMRKRQIVALEKEIRDVRGRAINFTEE